VSTVPVNFYPVDSAIMIADETRSVQMTIMNDRPQAGSSYVDGRIELLLNRRLYTNDGLGIPESLNETDAHGNGLNISAKFWMGFTFNR